MAASIPTETQILSNFLLSHASLKDIISLREFTEHFPREWRSNPRIKLLYREFQLARNAQCDKVKRNIEVEALAGAQHLQHEARKRKRAEGPSEDAMIGIELFGAPAAQPKLPLKELLRQMELAAAEEDSEQAAMANECDEWMAEMHTVVGDLSDLRYGKLADANTALQVGEQIEQLVGICARTLDS